MGQRDARLTGRLAPSPHGLVYRSRDVDLIRGHLPLARAAQYEQLVDDRGEPVDLLEARVELCHPRVLGWKPVAQLLELESNAGERRSQLVGGIGDEFLLASQEPREPAGHAVERVGEGPLLAASLDRRDRREVTVLDLLGGLLQVADRPGRLACDQAARDGTEKEHDAPQQGEPEDGRVGGVGDRRVALRHSHCADRLTGAEDRHRRGEQVLTQRGAVAHLLRSSAAERIGDLRP